MKKIFFSKIFFVFVNQTENSVLMGESEFKEREFVVNEYVNASSMYLTKKLTLGYQENYNKINAIQNDEEEEEKEYLLVNIDRVGDTMDNNENDLIVYKHMIIGTINSPEGRTSSMNPNVVSEYEVIDHLGYGTFGFVYKCLDKTTNKIVAMKVLKSQQAYFKQGLMEISSLTIVCFILF